MPSCMNIWFILMVSIPMIISLTNPRGESERSSAALHSVSSWLSPDDETSLEYDFYRETCPQAEAIVRSSMARIYYKQKDVPAVLLRLFFHDCFILVCGPFSSCFLLVLVKWVFIISLLLLLSCSYSTYCRSGFLFC